MSSTGGLKSSGETGGGEDFWGSKNLGKIRHSRRITSIPKQSSALQLKLKVIGQSLERLMSERQELDDVENILQKSLDDLDKEIAYVTRMANISKEAMYFQHGLSRRSIVAEGVDVQPKENNDMAPVGEGTSLTDAEKRIRSSDWEEKRTEGVKKKN